MSNRAVSLAAAAVLCAGLSLSMVTSASALTFATPTGPGYPPGTTTSIINPTFAAQADTVPIGGHFTVEECGFSPSTTANYTYNNGASGTFVADSNGCIAITIYAYDPHVTINGGPLLPANYQGNTIVVVGTGANTAPRTYTLTFNIVQPSAPPSSGSGTSSGSAGSSSGSGATPTASGSSPSGSGSGGDPTGTLAFTGSNSLATALAGLLLVVGGGLLVIFTRRRSEHEPR